MSVYHFALLLVVHWPSPLESVPEQHEFVTADVDGCHPNAEKYTGRERSAVRCGRV